MAEIVPLRPTAPASDRRPDRAAEPLWREALGHRLRTVRHDRGERLADTATRAGVSPQYLSEVERGLKDPSSEMVAAIAGALEVTIVELAAAVAADLGTAAASHAAAGCRATYALAA